MCSTKIEQDLIESFFYLTDETIYQLKCSLNEYQGNSFQRYSLICQEVYKNEGKLHSYSVQSKYIPYGPDFSQTQTYLKIEIFMGISTIYETDHSLNMLAGYMLQCIFLLKSQ